MAKRKAPGINTGSMADISFLLLTFFLLTSSINNDQGIPRRLPPPAPKEQQEQIIKVNERNVLKVLVNMNDALLVNGEIIPIGLLKSRALEFLENPYDRLHLPEKKLETIENLGEFRISKGVISLTNDLSTSYGMYIQVQNELQQAVNDLRDKVSKEKFGKIYNNLDTASQRAIQKAIPVNISEAPPINYGGR